MQYLPLGLSVGTWLFGGSPQDRSRVELKALPVCALFAMMPAMPDKTQLGLDGDVVITQVVKNKMKVPGTKKEITNLSAERAWNGDSQNDANLFNQAIMKIVNASGGDPLTQELLKRTAAGLTHYAQIYPDTSLAYSTFDNLAKLILLELNDPNKGKECPIEADRMRALVDMINHVYERVQRKVPYTAERNAALAYIRGLQMNDPDPLRQNQNVEVPT